MRAQAAEFELMKLSNKVRFILAVISGELKLNNRKKVDIEADMDSMQYDRIAPTKKASLPESTLPYCKCGLCRVHRFTNYCKHLERSARLCRKKLPIPSSGRYAVLAISQVSNASR